MATVVNSTGGDTSGSSMGLVWGLIALIVVVFLFMVFGMPLLRQSSAPQVNVPGQVDLNVNSGGQGQ